jgi:hypothetical protein
MVGEGTLTYIDSCTGSWNNEKAIISKRDKDQHIENEEDTGFSIAVASAYTILDWIYKDYIYAHFKLPQNH